MLIVEKITNIGNYRSFAVHKLHVEYHDTPDLDFA